MVSEYLEELECLKKFCLLSKGFYKAMQHRYKAACIKKGYVNEEAHRDLVDSQNYMSIYGKFVSQ